MRSVSFRAALFSVVILVGLPSCNHAAPPPSLPPTAVVASSQPEPLKPPPPLAALSPKELELRASLKANVAELAGKVGERNPKHHWEFASAADWLVEKFEALGCTVERQGFEIDSLVMAQNLVVGIPGKEMGREIVVVGAHYDSAEGSPGADDNATGIAALLALAQAFQKDHGSRSLRFVAFATRHDPHFRTPKMGSLVYGQQVIARGEPVIAMINLDSLGYFSDRAGSQSRPGALGEAFPDVGSFGAVVGGESSRELVSRFTDSLSRGASLPVRGAVLQEPAGILGDSDHWAFAQLGIPAVAVTDTRALRNPSAATAKDTPESLDYDRMARLVAGVEVALRGLVNPAPTPAASESGAPQLPGNGGVLKAPFLD